LADAKVMRRLRIFDDNVAEVLFSLKALS
jgi:hypothetical protein